MNPSTNGRRSCLDAVRKKNPTMLFLGGNIALKEDTHLEIGLCSPSRIATGLMGQLSLPRNAHLKMPACRLKKGVQ